MNLKSAVMMAFETAEGGILMPRVKNKNIEGETPGQRLARLRKERGLSQKEVADYLGVVQTTVSDYENDVAKLNTPLILKLTKFLKVSADELLGLKKTKSNGQVIRRAIFKRVQQIEKLPQRDQQALFRTIDAYLQKAS